MFYSYQYEGAGCGPATLSLLTGLDPAITTKLLNHKDSQDKDLLKQLKKQGIQYYPITKCEMTNTHYVTASKLTSQHVILMSQLFIKNEASWGILYDDIYYHNFRPCSSSCLDLLNRPVLSAYVLWKPSWGKPDKKNSF